MTRHNLCTNSPPPPPNAQEKSEKGRLWFTVTNPPFPIFPEWREVCTQANPAGRVIFLPGTDFHHMKVT